MSDTVIKVENLSKKYILSHQGQEKYTALRDVMANGIKNIGKKIFSPKTSNLNPTAQTSEEFFALKDVCFEIKQGDRVGIIGRNGAGKSTLLKILSRITEPSSGRIEIIGRVASLLEVGTGFHPELTGRENIYLNGAILGMTRREIKRKFDEIVAFAEVEKFLDTPVKHFSSGMYVRLAFAVAAHLEPEILVVDEVLAVGDAQFQKKCLGKMEDVSRKEGRTVLFVSHNMSAISALTKNTILLESGKIIYYGNTAGAVAKYLNPGISKNNTLRFDYNKKYIEKIELLQITTTCSSGGKLKLVVYIKALMPFSFNIEGWLKDQSDECILFFSEGQIEKVIHKIEKIPLRLSVEVDLPYLAEGTYYLSFALSEPNKMTFAGTSTSVEVNIVLCDPCNSGFSMKYNEMHRGKLATYAKTLIEYEN